MNVTNEVNDPKSKISRSSTLIILIRNFFSSMRVKISSFYPIINLAVIIVLLQSITLFQTTRNRYICGPSITFWKFIHLNLMCDSSSHLLDAANLGRLLRPVEDFGIDGTPYQNRPLFPLLARGLAELLKLLGTPDHRIAYSGIDGISNSYSVMIYLSYIFIHLAFLTFAVVLGVNYVTNSFRVNLTCKEILRGKFACAVALIIALNQVTKAIFWTPYAANLGIFFVIYFLYLISSKNNLVNTKFLIRNSLITLCLGLLYPFGLFASFLLVYLIIFNNKKIEIKRKIWLSFIAIAPLNSVWLLPRFIEMIGGKYKSVTVSDFREFMWVFDGISNGSIFKMAQENFISFIKSFTFPPFVFVLIIIVFSILTSRKKVILFSCRKLHEFKDEFIFLVMLAVYFYLLGIYDVRFEWLMSLALILVMLRISWPTIKKYENSFSFVNFFPSCALLTIWVSSIGPTFN